MNLILLVIAESTFLGKFCLFPIILIVIALIVAHIVKQIKKKQQEEESRTQLEKERKIICAIDKLKEGRHNILLNNSIELENLISKNELPPINIDFKLDENELGFAEVDIESIHNIRGSFQVDKQFDKLIITNNKFIFKGIRIFAITLNTIISIEDFDLSNENSNEPLYGYKITYKLRDKYNEIYFIINEGDINYCMENIMNHIKNHEFIQAYLISGEVSLAVDILKAFVQNYGSEV